MVKILFTTLLTPEENTIALKKRVNYDCVSLSTLERKKYSTATLFFIRLLSLWIRWLSTFRKYKWTMKTFECIKMNVEILFFLECIYWNFFPGNRESQHFEEIRLSVMQSLYMFIQAHTLPELWHICLLSYHAFLNSDFFFILPWNAVKICLLVN